MDFDSDFLNKISKLALELGLTIASRESESIAIFDDTQHDFFLRAQVEATGFVIVYFVFRTNSFSYDGERTDLHDVQSSLFSLCCAVHGFSAALWDVSNGFTEIESELYARWATVVQPNLSVISQDEAGLEKLKQVLFLYRVFQAMLVEYRTASSKKRSYCWDRDDLFALRTKIALGLEVPEDDVVVMERTSPDWRYIQIHRLGLAGFCSKYLGNMLENSLKVSASKRAQIVDEATVFQKSNWLRLCYSDNEKSQLNSLTSLLSAQDPSYIASESHLFAISGDCIMSQRGDFGIARFKAERENFSRTLRSKINFLFDNPALRWCSEASAERFELLCRDLLVREVSIIRTRIVSPTNQPDRGRDIVADIISVRPTSQLLYTEEQPVAIKKFVVQCKYSQSTVGIPRSPGPFEVVYLGDYDGYFLVTNARISSDFTALLEKLRRDGRFTAEWWSTEELEERLKQSPDLIEKYSDVVSY